jgi:hypothetical protein
MLSRKVASASKPALGDKNEEKFLDVSDANEFAQKYEIILFLRNIKKNSRESFWRVRKMNEAKIHK